MGKRIVKPGTPMKPEFNGNIEDAVIIDEVSNLKSIKVDEPIIDVKNEEVKEKTKPQYENIELNEDKKDKHNPTFKMRLDDNDTISDFVKKETKQGKNDTDESMFAEEDTVQNIRSELEKDVNNFTPKDFEGISSMAIDIIDMLFASLLRTIAADNSDAPYELTEAKKKAMKKSLSYVMIKHAKKVGIEWMLLGTFLSVYAAPFLAATGRRKQVNKAKKLRLDGKINQAEEIENSLKRGSGNPSRF